MLAAKVAGGPLLDRIGAGRISVAGDQVCAAGMLVLAITGTPPLWLIVIVMVCVGAAEGPSGVAKTVLLPDATRTAGRSLSWATGLTTTIERSATTLGPILAGLLLAVIGDPRLVWLLAATLFAGAALLASACNTNPPPPAPVPGYWRALGVGARFLIGDQSLTALIVMFVVTNALDQALLANLLPLWASTGGHSPALIGAAISAAAASAVLTTLFTTLVGHRVPRRVIYLAGAFVSGPTRFAALAAGLSPASVLIVFAIAGLGSGLINPLVDAVQLERIPAHLRGRALSLIRTAAWSGIPAGAATGALLHTAVGLPGALWACAATYLGAVLYPSWRVIWHPSAEPAPPEPAP